MLITIARIIGWLETLSITKQHRLEETSRLVVEVVVHKPKG